MTNENQGTVFCSCLPCPDVYWSSGGKEAEQEKAGDILIHIDCSFRCLPLRGCIFYCNQRTEKGPEWISTKNYAPDSMGFQTAKVLTECDCTFIKYSVISAIWISFAAV